MSVSQLQIWFRNYAERHPGRLLEIYDEGELNRTVKLLEEWIARHITRRTSSTTLSVAIITILANVFKDAPYPSLYHCRIVFELEILRIQFPHGHLLPERGMNPQFPGCTIQDALDVVIDHLKAKSFRTS